MDSNRKRRGYPLRTGEGPFYRPGPAERSCFLEAVARQAPEVVAGLGALLPAYRRLQRRTPRTRRKNLPFDLLACWLHDNLDAVEYLPAAARCLESDLKKSVFAWAEQFGLNAPWIVEAAFHALAVGRDYNGSLFAWASFVPPPGGVIRRFEFHFREWNPTSESEDKYTKAVTAAFKDRLNGYLVEEDPDANAQLKRASLGTSKEWFDWLALRLCCGKMNREIAGICNVDDESTISHGLHGAAVALGLPLPRRKRGKRTPDHNPECE